MLNFADLRVSQVVMNLGNDQLTIQVAPKEGEQVWTSDPVPFAIMAQAPKFLADLGVNTEEAGEQIDIEQMRIRNLFLTTLNDLVDDTGEIVFTRLGGGRVQVQALDNDGTVLAEGTGPVHIVHDAFDEEDARGTFDETVLSELKSAALSHAGTRSLTLIDPGTTEGNQSIAFTIIVDGAELVNIQKEVDTPTLMEVYDWFFEVSQEHVDPVLEGLRTQIAEYFGISAN